MKQVISSASFPIPRTSRFDSEKALEVVRRSSLRFVPKKTTSERTDALQIRLSDLGDVRKSPLELDLEIQTQRVLHVLDSTIATLETALWIPLIVKKGNKFLRHYFSEEETTFIITSCSTYINSDYKDRIQTEISVIIDDIHKTVKRKAVVSTLPSPVIAGSNLKREASRRHSAQSQRPKVRKISALDDGPGKADPHIAYVVELLCTNEALKNCLKKQQPLPESHSTMFILLMKRVRDIAAYKMSINAVEEAEREKLLKTAWKMNTDCLEEVSRLSNQLAKQREEFGEQLGKKETFVEEYAQKIASLEAKFDEDVRKAVQESEKIMAEDNEDSNAKQIELKAEAENVKQRYQALLDENLKSEKKLRAKKYKVETQLASWLAKYDQDIGDRQAEFEQLQKEFNEETEQMNELQAKFDEQAVEYDELMAEKEEEERKAFEEKAYQFLLNRSARRIQRYWREYRERKLARKRARRAKSKQKGKGGKKGAKKIPAPKKDEHQTVMGQDPNALLDKKFKGELLQDVKADSSFTKKDIVVDLTK